MKIEKNRHLLIIDALFQSEEAITAEKLAVLSRSSVRSVKSDIVLLNKQLSDEGVGRIESSVARGYTFKVEDKDKFKEMTDEIKAMKRLYHNRQIDETNRCLYILQRILTEEYVLIENLCDDLFVSRSLISKDMERVKNFLETYDITMSSVSGKGLIINGDELSKRSAMVETHYSQYYDYQQFYFYKPFNDMFYTDKKLFEDIRHEFLKIIRRRDISVSDLAAKAIPTYICLSISRCAMGKNVELSKETEKELKNTVDYDIMKELMENEAVGHHFNFSDTEIANLARVLLISRDFDMRSKGMADIPMTYIKENTVLYNNVLKKAKKKLGKSLYNVEFYRFIELDVESLQLQLYLKNRFDSTKKKKLVTYVERDESLLSPVALEMARIMVDYLQDELNSKILESVVTAYAAYYELVFKRIIFPYHRMKLLATATEGLVYCQNLKENLLRKYGDYIQAIDAYNLYEMRKLNFDDYDALIHSGNLMYYNYPLKSITYDEIDYQKDNDNELKKFFKQGYDRTRINQIKNFLRVEEDVTVDNPDYFIESLFYRYCDKEENRRNLVNDYYRKRKIIDYYSVKQMSLVIMMDYKLVKKEVMDIYVLKEPTDYHGHLETRFIVMACLNPDNDVTSLKIDNYVLQCINQLDGVVDMIIEDKNVALDTIYDRVLD